MANHPIQGLMQTAMENIRDMVDVNTIVGDPVETPDGANVIVPISRVSFGFVAAGSEFHVAENGGTGGNGRAGGSDPRAQGYQGSGGQDHAFPFGGGSGGGVSITPIAFLVVGSHGIKVIPLDNDTHLFEKMIDLAPQVVDKIQQMLGKKNGGATGPDTSNPTGVQPVNVTIRQ
jgi:sporulation protein YtfJ